MATADDDVTTFTARPGVETRLQIRTLPNATCRFRCEGADDPVLEQVASPGGLLDVHLTSDAEGESITLTVDAEVDGVVRSHRLEVRIAEVPTRGYPFCTPEPEPIGPHDVLRPALSGAERRSLADREILRRGYPPRPGEGSSAEGHAAWERIVARPVVVVAPALAPRPRPSITPASIVISSPNWCGAIRSGPPGSIVGVSGRWRVPAIVGDRSQVTESALWVGLDGDEGQALPQGGTTHRSVPVPPPGSVSYLTSYWAWSEFFNSPSPGSNRITNVPVGPGDDITATLYVINISTGRFDVNGATVYFVITNATTNRAATIAIPRGATTIFGARADWIMERPGPPLADFGSMQMTECHYLDSAGEWKNWYDGNGDFVTMKNAAGDQLAYPVLVDNDVVGLVWQRSN